MEPDPDEHLYPGEEDLIWKDHENQRGNKPKGLYSKTGETARALLSTQTQCALFCGGKKCKYCSGEGWAEHETVIKGLYSQWVTDNMLAMARPSTFGVEKHNLVQQFQDNNINTIINLQMPGEHADCGPNKLDDSGFLYNPQTFMEKGIYFYNFGCCDKKRQKEDYGVASLSTILDIVKVMQFAVSVGKVAVHCHAGRGRTGVIIACYLVFTNRITGREAIHYVREKRPQSIQTRQQMQVIEEFEMYLKPFRTVFASRFTGIIHRRRHTLIGVERLVKVFCPHPCGSISTSTVVSIKEKGSHEFSLKQFLNRQRHILHGYEARRLKYIPKVVYIVSERLLELARKGSSLQSHQNRNQPRLNKTFSNLSVTSSKSYQPLEGPQIKTSSSSSNLSQLGKKKRRFKPSLASTRTRYKSVSMEDLSDSKLKGFCDGEDSMSGESSNSFAMSKTSDSVDEDDDDDIVWGSSTVDLKTAASDKESGRKIIPLNSRVSDLSRGFDDASSTSGTITWSIDQSIAGEMSEDYVKEVSQALYTDKNYCAEFALRYESLLNETDNAWIELAKESNPHVLCQLLWDWFDQLKEPVLRSQDLGLILQWLDEPSVGIQKLEKGVRFTIEYLLKVLAKLKPMEENCLGKIYEKLLSHLTHQWAVNPRLHGGMDESMRQRDQDLTDRDHWREMPEDMAEGLFHFCRKLQDHVDTSRKSKS